jgi:hypothetical protein
MPYNLCKDSASQLPSQYVAEFYRRLIQQEGNDYRFILF